MSTLIIAQNKDDIRGVLRRYRMSEWNRFLNQHKLKYGFNLNIEILKSPSGERVYGFYISTANQVKKNIVAFAKGQLASQQADVVKMRVIFMFHQTASKVVRTINRALRQLPNDRDWRLAPFRAGKHLQVEVVTLLSCESGIDKTFQPGPNPPTVVEMVRRGYAEQAATMRTLAGKGFATPMAPPPTNPQGWYDPAIVTFSTGDMDKGGVELNPFGFKFKLLPGSFRSDGTWGFDPHPSGRALTPAEQSGSDSAGTIYTDYVNQGTSTSAPLAAGASVSLIQ